MALVCRDMERTVAFYTKVLGMTLKKGFDLGNGYGQHFFFDMGGGSELGFFWFRDAPEAQPGIASPGNLVGSGEGTISSAHGSMNHVAFHVPAEAIDDYVGRLRDAGVECSEVMNHDDSEWGVARDVHDGVFVRSVYFRDPDGILLEFAAWTRELDLGDVSHKPAQATGI